MEPPNKAPEDLRKGPWKAEEDEVLLKHVSKYGPRDWSSIRSKGLLQRTGKSCRLRWVNKLRPNLKNGCKFTAEEERVVIELQAQFGNKWAKIATFLPGRTDNDVKNFWSSRQKRLARILQTSASSSSSNTSKSHRSRKNVAFFHQVPVLEDRMLASSMKQESCSKALSCSTSYMENHEEEKMALLPSDLIKQELPEYDRSLLQIEAPILQVPPVQHPILQVSQVQPEFTFSPESHELLARMEDPYLFNVFGTEVAPELGGGGGGGGAQLSLGPPLFDSVAGCMNDVKHNATPDTFFDDFPTDMFDHIEPFPSPSDW